MANLYFNNAVDTSLDTLGNWWLDDAFTTPAGALPTESDDIYMAAFDGDAVEENIIQVGGGAVTCSGGIIYGFINGGTFHNADWLYVYHYPLGYTFSDNIFAGIVHGRCLLDSINASGSFHGEAIIANWVVAYGYSMFHYKLAFENWSIATAHGVTEIMAATCAVSFDGGASYWYPPGHQDVAAPADVRQGVSNLGQTGTLGGGTLSITVE